MSKKTPKAKELSEQIKEPTQSKPKVKLVSFSVKATIPTQQYGNIMPEIVVTASTIEDAREAVMPMIEQLYGMYAEEPLNGRGIKFLKRDTVTSVEKTVDTKSPTKTEVTAVNNVVVDVQEVVPANDSYKKAESAIQSAVSFEALNLIEDKIQASTKINKDDKPLLYTFILKRKKEFQN